MDIEVLHCGICHSDLSMLSNHWGFSTFPLVAGHEVTGRVKSLGSRVNHLKIGDLVGLGWHAGYCMECSQCMTGHHNTCATGEMTIVGRHGGFADHVGLRRRLFLLCQKTLILLNQGHYSAAG